jgi:hypothetical protein
MYIFLQLKKMISSLQGKNVICPSHELWTCSYDQFLFSSQPRVMGPQMREAGVRLGGGRPGRKNSACTISRFSKISPRKSPNIYEHLSLNQLAGRKGPRISRHSPHPRICKTVLWLVQSYQYRRAQQAFMGEQWRETTSPEAAVFRRTLFSGRL